MTFCLIIPGLMLYNFNAKSVTDLYLIINNIVNRTIPAGRYDNVTGHQPPVWHAADGSSEITRQGC